jgi:predicted hydrocarbon binding protein
LEAQEILKAMGRMQYEKLFGLVSSTKVRDKLGDAVDLLSFQERILGVLSLSKSMGPVLFEAGKRPALYIVEEMWPKTRRQPDYHGIADCKNLDEARLSSEFVTLRFFLETTRLGLLNLTEFERDRLVVFQIEECAICYGIGDMGRSVCYFLGGIIAGTLEGILGRRLGFAESKCCAKLDPVCEFRYSL